MEVPTIAVAILGGAFDAEELGDNDIEPVTGILEKLQEQMVTGFNDVHIDLIDRSHFDRVTAERDALQLRLNAVEEENDLLRQMRGIPAAWRVSVSGEWFYAKTKEECERERAEYESTFTFEELNEEGRQTPEPIYTLGGLYGSYEIAGYEGSSGLYYSRLAAVANGEQLVEPVYRVKK